MKIANIIAFILLAIGGINWLLVGAFGFDVVAAVFGAGLSVVASIIYILVGLSALWLIFVAFYRHKIVFTEGE